ncbi:ADP-heptose--lipooligosaccharide heptosyltransferase II [Grimontia indica]|uniref:lipopolysaccharide heptosyltransferase II n=1 Tax=Grimontia indica TaxID=1056512 RepID=R1ILY0_9GAMM|nr:MULTISPECIES: lipopolysaccharide heptosyltransferase II [Grimontia]EOD81721.1 ADP-heptose--lipooligosaccharide heptosyltransferase II [Grimontia indica]
MHSSQHASRWLIIGPSWVGDMVMSQSLYKTIKAKFSNARIHVLAPAWCRPILERMPEVDRAIEMPIGHGEFNLAGRWRLGRSLKRESYTHSIVLPNSAKSALIPLFADIPVRTGWKGEMRYGLLNDLRPSRNIFQYMVERYVALAYTHQDMVEQVQLKDIPKPSLLIDEDNKINCLKKFSINNSKDIIGICPGAEFGPAKRWPEKHYAKVAEWLLEEGKQICFFGGPKDKDVTRKIIHLIPKHLQKNCFDLAGKTSLNDAVDVLAACNVVFSNDSGLMHVAASVNTRIVAIFGSSSPEYTPPLSTRVAIVSNDIDCRPCFKRQCPLEHLKCLDELSPSTVFSAYKRIKQS